jgi:transcriptional regulator with XRE-family HTH domain
MTIREFLNKKYYDMQAQKSGKIKVEEFAKLFGAPQSLMSMWLNGERIPGPKYKKQIIERYGDEAVEAFGEDPRLYFINQNWAKATKEKQDSIYTQMQNNIGENDTKRVSSKRKEKRSQ